MAVTKASDFGEVGGGKMLGGETCEFGGEAREEHRYSGGTIFEDYSGATLAQMLAQR